MSTASTEFVPESYPYDVDPDDHCETSITAYQHALPVLDFLRKKLGKAREELHIYDPYYCAGCSLHCLLNFVGGCFVLFCFVLFFGERERGGEGVFHKKIQEQAH